MRLIRYAESPGAGVTRRVAGVFERGMFRLYLLEFVREPVPAQAAPPGTN